MLKDFVTFIGMGQCGGNYTEELEQKKNMAFYVNSSLDDLDTIDTDYDKKYCIENTKGMAKDIEYANEVITSDDNDEKIAVQIFKKNSNAHIYFFIFGLSGGTGGGMTVQVMRKFKDCYPDKTVNAIVVLPHEDEDMIMHYNAYKCCEELEKCLNEGVVTNIQILDNNSKEFSEKLSINKEFTELFDEILSFNQINKTGNLDEEELERLFNTNGITVIYKLPNGDIADNLNELDNNTIYTNFNRDPKVHGLILSESQNNSINRSLIKEAFGYPMVTHDIIWDKDYSIIISTGMTFYKSIITKLKNNFNKLLQKKQELEKTLNNEEKENVVIDESILKNLNNNSYKSNVQRPSTRNRRGNAVGVKGETRYRR